MSVGANFVFGGVVRTGVSVALGLVWLVGARWSCCFLCVISAGGRVVTLLVRLWFRLWLRLVERCLGLIRLLLRTAVMRLLWVTLLGLS